MNIIYQCDDQQHIALRCSTFSGHAPKLCVLPSKGNLYLPPKSYFLELLRWSFYG